MWSLYAEDTLEMISGGETATIWNQQLEQLSSRKAELEEYAKRGEVHPTWNTKTPYLQPGNMEQYVHEAQWNAKTLGRRPILEEVKPLNDPDGHTVTAIAKSMPYGLTIQCGELNRVTYGLCDFPIFGYGCVELWNQDNTITRDTPGCKSNTSGIVSPRRLQIQSISPL